MHAVHMATLVIKLSHVFHVAKLVGFLMFCHVAKLVSFLVSAFLCGVSASKKWQVLIVMVVLAAVDRQNG